MTIHFPQELQDKFCKKATRIFPREEFAILVGKKIRGGIKILDIHFPAQRLKESSETQIMIYDSWFDDCIEKYKSQNLYPVSTLHSHCYYKPRDLFTGAPGSVEDFSTFAHFKEYLPSLESFGIMKLNKFSNKIKTYLNFWPSQNSFKVLS